MARPNGVVSIADSLPPELTQSAQPPATPAPPAEAPAVAPAAEPEAAAPEAVADNMTGAKIGLSEAALEQGVRNSVVDTDAPEPEVKEAVAEKVSKSLSLDVVKKTEFQGNGIIEMSDAQRSAYAREVSEVQEKIKGAERAYVLAQWYMGQTALKLQRDAKDHAGSTYGQATVEGFAHDIGRDKSTVYKSMKLAKNLSFSHAQALTISVEAFQVIQKAPDKIREWVIEDLVRRCQTGQKLDTAQVERVVETLSWYPSITAQADKPADVTKAIDAIVAWDPKPLPGKDKPAFDMDAAKKAISSAAPDLITAVKSDEKSAKAAEKSKRDQPGLNSKTGTSHVGVAKAFAKALEAIIEKAGSLTISIKEATEDGELSDKAYDNFAEIIEGIVNDADNGIDVLEGIKKAAEDILENEPDKPTKGPKKKAKPRAKKK